MRSATILAVVFACLLTDRCVAGTIYGTVTDATTGEPIKRFRVMLCSRGERPFVLYNRAEEFEDGAYDYSPGVHTTAPAIRIEADGYAPVVSDVINLGGEDIAFDVQMQPSTNLTQFILRPDGTPAQDALVLLRTPGSHISLKDEAPTRQTICPTARTDADGRFSFPPVETDFRLVVLSDSGYLDIRSSEINPDEPLKLIAWARLEGSLNHGTKPAANQPVNIFWNVEPQDLWVHRSYQVQTDDAGRFVFERLPAGRPRVGQQVAFSRDPLSPYTITGACPVELSPGKTTTIELGGIGRPVIGRLSQFPDEDDHPWKVSHASMSTRPPSAPLPVPAHIKDEPGPEFSAWYGKWLKSPESRAWFDERERERRAMKHHAFCVEDNGTFRMENVEPGTYDLCVRIAITDERGLPTDELVREYTTEITIPPIPGGQSDEPIDVGVIRPD